MPSRGPIAVAAAGLALLGMARYRRDLRCDYERLARFEPSVIETPFGRVEYAQVGEGPPVMVVRGGFDFGVGVGVGHTCRPVTGSSPIAVRVLPLGAAAGSVSRRAGRRVRDA